ncbi:sodium/solute symporter [Opitutales bacterium]|jgi:solute:Na+ symporter, SSS family|nr:sodium/solute symporter [Opitutales bacterium]
MESFLSTTDLFIFFGSLATVMGFGLWASRRGESSEDYFLAGRTTRWWGVAGSIFGSNVSANHIAGMMGVGYLVGFAQSQFEITAIAGLLLLCYGFLPVYRKMNVYTLSEYLGRRYDDRSRMAFAIVMIVIMVVVQMVPGFYFGSRSVNRLLQGDTGRKAVAEAIVNANGSLAEIKITSPGRKYASVPRVEIQNPEDYKGVEAEATAVVEDGSISTITLSTSGSKYNATAPPKVLIQGGNLNNSDIAPGDVDPQYYMLGIIIMALVTGGYVIFGGLRAVIVTDVIQSVLMLVGGLTVAFIVFGLPEVGGWSGMRAMDAAAAADAQKMHLYEPSDHPSLPWTGMLSGLMVLHFFYWGTNQFIVQRALSARTDKEARIGIITAGFFKLLIPFFSIGTGIAAYYLFKKQDMNVASDDVFITLLTQYVKPIGFGVLGLVAAGLIGAILSTVDSMLNSAATIITFDIYKKYINPAADEKKLVWVGRVWIAIFIVIAGLVSILIMDPNSKSPFFIYVAANQMKLVSGLVVAFLVGMFWKRATGAGGITAILSGLFFSFAFAPPQGAPWPSLYEFSFAKIPWVVDMFGPKLNFFHAAFLAAIIAFVLHIVVSLRTQPDKEKGKLTWTELGGHDPSVLKKAGIKLLLTLGLYLALALAMVGGWVAPIVAGTVAAIWTWFTFAELAFVAVVRSHVEGKPISLFSEDRFWAGLLAALAIFMMYYYY